MPFGSPFRCDGHQSLILKGVMTVFKVTRGTKRRLVLVMTHTKSPWYCLCHSWTRPTSTTGKQRELAEVTMALWLWVDVKYFVILKKHRLHIMKLPVMQEACREEERLAPLYTLLATSRAYQIPRTQLDVSEEEVLLHTRKSKPN